MKAMSPIVFYKGREAVEHSTGNGSFKTKEVEVGQNSVGATASAIDEIRELTEQYKNTPEAYKQVPLYSKLLDLLNDRYGTRPPKEVDEMVRSIFNLKDATGILRLGYYIERLGKEDEAIKCYKESFDVGQNYKALAALAKLYSKMNLYEDSSRHFEQCLKMPIDVKKNKLRIMFNYGYTLYAKGNYKKANELFKELTVFFEEVEDSERDDQYWLDYGDHNLYDTFRPFEALECYEKGLNVIDKTDETQTEILIELVNASNKCASQIAHTDKSRYPYYLQKGRDYYKMACDKLTPGGVMASQKLGDLNLYQRNLPEAKKFYEKLLESKELTIGEEKSDVYYFMGLCNLFQENYTQALVEFKKSIHINDATYINVHLAKCHSMLSRFNEAEELLDKVLYEAPYDTNAMLSQVFLYMDWADTLKEKNADIAFSYYDRSVEISSTLLAQNGDIRYSRQIVHNESRELTYAIGYCYVEQSKITPQKREKITYLQKAREQLSTIAKSNDSAFFFKAKKTSDGLDKIIDDFNRSGKSTKKYLTRIGIFTFLVALFMIFVGKPSMRSGYRLDTAIIAHQMGINKAVLDSVFKDKPFNSKEEMQDYVKAMYGDSVLNQRHVTIMPMNVGKFETTKVDDTYIIFFLSMGLVFVLLGLLQNEIKTLKVGVIEIQKSEHITLVDQVELKMSR